MKHKLLNKLLTLALLTLGGVINPVWATDYSLTPDQSSTGSTATTYITTLTEFTHNGVSWKMNQWNPKNLQVKTNQSSASSEFRFYNTSAFPGRITQVVITFSALTVSDASKLMFLGGSSEVTATTGGTAGTWNSTTKTLTWTPSGSDNFTYFAFYQNGKAASGNNYLASSDAIVVTYTTPTHTLTYSATNGSISGVDAESASVASGDDVAEGAIVTLTATPSSGYIFSSWAISGTGSTLSSTSTNPTTFTMGTADATVTANFVSAPSCATPTFSVAAGTYTSDQSVTLSTATEGASIYYTTNGDTPTSGSTLYSSAITVSESMTIKAIAIKAGMADSDVASASYTINKPTPELSFSEDSYDAYLGSAFAAPTLTNTNSVSPITYSSSDTDVATVNESTGAINLVGEGSTTITASFAGNSSYTAAQASYTLNVSDPAVATTVTISDAGITNTDVYVSTTAGSFAAIVKDNEDEAVGGAAVTWTSSNTEVATINASTGAVTLVKAGTTTITATYAGVAYTYLGSSNTYELTVTSSEPITDDTFTFSALGYSNGANVTTVEGVACTLTFAKATGSTDPAYYTTGTGVRMYNKNTLTISSATKTIQSIEFTFASGYETLSLVSGQPGSLSDASASKRTWTGSANSVQFTNTTSTQNRIQVIKVTYDNRVESDLTKTGDVTLDFKDGNTDAYLTEYFTSSSTGAYTYTVADETIIENADELISALKVGSTTVTVSQAADATYKAGEITINVTVNDTRTVCVTGLDLASAKTIVKDAAGDLLATATIDGEFTGTINYTYVSANEDIFYIDGTEYLGAGVGATTVTVTATPTGGNAASYSPVSAVVDVTVNGTNSISLNKSSHSVTYSAETFEIEATVPTENYNGTVTASSSNTNVAIVSVEGTTVTVTPVSVGATTITVTAGTDTYYLTTASETCNVTITAPEGSDEAPASDVAIFNETFDNSTGTSGWSGSAGNGTPSYDNSGWSGNSVYGSGGSIKLGASSTQGYVTTPALNEAGDFTLTFKAGAWKDDKTEDGLELSIVAGTGTLGTTTFTLKNAAWDTYETTITGASADTKIKFSATLSSKNRFFLDDVKVIKHIDPSETVTLNKYGYATYCSVNPIDFSSTEGYTAWRVSGIDGTTITFNKITDAIKGGQGVLLYNKDADGENKTDVTINFADGTTVFDNEDLDDTNDNLLVGTTAPTYIGSEEYYGLKGEAFVPVTAGPVPAGKALLPVPSGGSIKAFTFIFDDEATGIRTVETVSAEEAAQIFDLSGRRISKMQKGINIVNGKKVLY